MKKIILKKEKTMKRFCISYDLHNAGKEEYDEVEERLGRMGSRRILRSTWRLDCGDENESEDIMAYLRNFIDERHDIYICEVAKNERTQQYKQSWHGGR